MRKKYIALAGLLIAIDQLIKAFIRLYPEGYVIASLSPWVEFRRVTNTGAAFSILSSGTIIITILSAAIMVALCCILVKKTNIHKGNGYALAGLIGGGIGNLIDRLIWGGVTDYINLLFIRFPVFNFADICITVSVIILLVLICFEHELGRHEEGHDGKCS